MSETQDKFSIAVFHEDVADRVTMTVIPDNPEQVGVSVTMTSKFARDLARCLTEPNGSGMIRDFGRFDAVKLTEAERAEAIKRAEEQRQRDEEAGKIDVLGRPL